MTPLIVGAKAVLNPTSAMKNRAEPVISMVFRRLISRSEPSSPISKNPTEIVMVKTSRPLIITQRLLASRIGSATFDRPTFSGAFGIEDVGTANENDIWPSSRPSQNLGIDKKERGWTRPLV